MKKYSIIAMICLLLSGSIHAQVTIGKSEKPIAGALLDLKNLDTPGADGSTANKGMMLPRVELTNIDKLYPMLPTGYDASEDAKHNGLVVFNMGTSDIELCLGIYVWDSLKWNRIPEACNNSLWSTTNLLFYKSALAAKSITLDLSRDNAKVTWAHDNAIPWLAGGFPLNDTRKISKTFSFRPQPNTANADLVSAITATINSGNETNTETITITQLNREMKFEAPATVQPAVGAQHSLNIDAEADWTATISATNPGTMITAIADNSQTAGNNKTLKVTLANNDTWAERIAKLDITSTNPDFLPRTVDVKQGIATPLITITSGPLTPAGDIEFDISGAVAGAETKVAFTTNADWYYAEDNTGVAGTTIYQNVIGSALPGVTLVHSGGPGTHTIDFIPTTQGNHHPAGTELKTNLVLESRNHGTAPQSKRNLLVKRTVPALFYNLVVSPAWGTKNIMPNGKTTDGEDITLTADTNCWWGADWHIDGTSNTGGSMALPASTYGNKTLTVALPTYMEWGADRILNIRHSIDGVNYHNVSAYWQKGYNLYHDMGGTTNLPGTAGNGATQLNRAATSYDVDMKTDSQTPNFRMHSNDQTNGYNTLWTDGDFTQNAGNRGVHVPANDTWAGRTVGIHYDRPGWPDANNPEGWYQVGSYWQPGYDLSANLGNLPTTIPAQGGQDIYDNSLYYVDTWSTNGCPNFQLLVTDGINADNSPGGNWLWHDNHYNWNVGARYFYIPAAVSMHPRTLHFFVEKANHKWEYITSRTQDGQPWIDAGNWWIHKTPATNVGTIRDNRLAVAQVNAACSSAYGAEWQAVWKYHYWNDDFGVSEVVTDAWKHAFTAVNRDLLKQHVTANYIYTVQEETAYGNGAHAIFQIGRILGFNKSNGNDFTNTFTGSSREEAFLNTVIVGVLCAKPK